MRRMVEMTLITSPLRTSSRRSTFGRSFSQWRDKNQNMLVCIGQPKTITVMHKVKTKTQMLIGVHNRVNNKSQLVRIRTDNGQLLELLLKHELEVFVAALVWHESP